MESKAEQKQLRAVLRESVRAALPPPSPPPGPSTSSDEDETEAILRAQRATKATASTTPAVFATAASTSTSSDADGKRQRVGPCGSTPPGHCAPNPQVCASSCGCHGGFSFLPPNAAEFRAMECDTDGDNNEVVTESPPAHDLPDSPACMPPLDPTEPELSPTVCEPESHAGLDSKQLDQLAALRLKISTKMGPLEAHPFHLFNNGTEWMVQCDVCNRSPMKAGVNRFFLANFWTNHLNKPSHQEAVNPPVEATVQSSPGPLATDSHTLPQQQQFSGPLEVQQLELLAARDAATLSVAQREQISATRQHCASMHGGAFIHSFRVICIDMQCSEPRFAAICDCDGAEILCDQSDRRFLDHFRRHLGLGQHRKASAQRYASWCATFRDEAAHAAAAAAAAAAAGMLTTATDLESMQQFAANAAVAAERAATAATAAAAGYVPTPEQPPAAGSVLPELLVRSELEELIHMNPALSWQFTEDLNSDGWWQPSCDWCGVRFSHASDANALRVIRQHLGSNHHREQTSYGGRTLLNHFFTARTGPTPPPPASVPPPDRSTLCAGYHRKWVLVGRRDVDVTPLLQAEVSEESTYYPEPHFQRTLQLATGDGGTRSLEIKGTFRSRECSGFCVDAMGHVLPYGICAACRRIPKIPAFQKRALRWAAGAGTSAKGSRFEYMSAERRLVVMRALRAKVLQLNSTVFLLQQSYSRKCRRVQTLLQRLKGFAVEGDAKGMINDIIAIERSGKFEQRVALLNFVRDMLHALKLRDGAHGKRSRNMRWHTSSKRIFAVLRKYGGPKTTRFMHETLEACDDKTTRTEWRRTKMHFDPGEVEVVVKRVGELYGALKKAKGIDGPVMYERSEDDTTVPGASEFNQRLDSLIGFCGPLARDGQPHVCNPHCSIVIGEGDDAYSIIEDAHTNYQLAGYLRVVVVNPLHEELPRLTIVVHAHCNRFTTAWLKQQWEEEEELCARLISPFLGDDLNAASDGDARRFALQKAGMLILPSAPGRFGLIVAGFTHSCKLLSIGAIANCFSQDPRHNWSKLWAHTDSNVRRLQWGAWTATHTVIVTIFEGGRFAHSEHGLSAAAAYRSDRMNKRAPAECCSCKVRACMQRLIDGDTTHPPEPEVKGTLYYAKLVSYYIVLNMGKKATLYERVKMASYVIHTLRRARGHVVDSKTLTLKQHFLPKQTYEHVILGCFSATLKIIAHTLPRYAPLPVCLRKSGSNPCEETFAELGGFGRVVAGRRNYTVNGALSSAGDLNTIELYAHDPDVPLAFGSKNHKLDFNIEAHEEQARENADMRAHRTLESYLEAWRNGDAESRQDCIALGMNSTRRYFNYPDEDEQKQVEQMRIATFDEMGDEVSPK